MTSTETLRTTSQLADDLQRSRDILAGAALRKGGFHAPDSRDEFCTVGAVIEALDLNIWNDLSKDQRLNDVVNALAETLGIMPDPYMVDDPGLGRRTKIYDFNDSEATTKADVLDLFDAAIARL